MTRTKILLPVFALCAFGALGDIARAGGPTSAQIFSPTNGQTFNAGRQSMLTVP